MGRARLMRTIGPTSFAHLQVIYTLSRSLQVLKQHLLTFFMVDSINIYYSFLFFFAIQSDQATIQAVTLIRGPQPRGACSWSLHRLRSPLQLLYQGTPAFLSSNAGNCSSKYIQCPPLSSRTMMITPIGGSCLRLVPAAERCHNPKTPKMSL